MTAEKWKLAKSCGLHVLRTLFWFNMDESGQTTLEMVDNFGQTVEYIKGFFAFTRQGSEVQNLSRLPLEANEIGTLLQRLTSRFSFRPPFRLLRFNTSGAS
jgi:hypothetical protein